MNKVDLIKRLRQFTQNASVYSHRDGTGKTILTIYPPMLKESKEFIEEVMRYGVQEYMHDKRGFTLVNGNPFPDKKSNV